MTDKNADFLELIMQNDVENVKALFNDDKNRFTINPNFTDENGNTALMLAAKNGNVELMDFLIKRGASLDGRNNEGKTVEDLAAEAIGEGKGNEPFFYIAGEGLKERDDFSANLRDLLEKIKKANEQRKENSEQYKEKITTNDQQLIKNSTLNFHQDQTEEIKKYEDNDLDYNEKIKKYENRISADDEDLLLKNFKEITNDPIKTWKEVSYDENKLNNKLLTIISNLGIEEKHLDLEEVRILLELGANPNQAFMTKSEDFGDNNNLLHKAALYADPKLAELLLEHGARISAKNSLGKTPLDLAIEAKNKEMIIFLETKISKMSDHLLINAIADLDPEEEHLDLSNVKKILNDGVNPNAIHKETGNTAIHGAAYFKDPKLAELLLKRGASLSAKNKEGRTPLQIAMETGNAAVIRTFTHHDPVVNLTTKVILNNDEGKVVSPPSPVTIAQRGDSPIRRD